MNSEIKDLQKIVSENYKEFESVLSIEPLTFKFRVNNLLYLALAGKKKYILKRIKILNDFYGISDAAEKLEMISAVSDFLAKNDFPIEKVIVNKSGHFMLAFKQDTIRAFEYYESREFNSSDMQDTEAVFKLSKQLHSFPIEQLLKELPDSQQYLKAPYPLDETFKKAEWISEKLNLERGEQWESLQSQFSKVIEAVPALLKWEKSHLYTLTHLDLHPRNVIFREDNRPLMIDMDYMRLGNPYVCLGFSLTRLSFLQQPIRTLERLKTFLKILTKVYLPVGEDAESFEKEVLKGALYIETEKIFRNLYRNYHTQNYRNFAEDVPAMHFPIYQLVNEYFQLTEVNEWKN